MRSFCARLPAPLARYATRGATFVVYRAKSPGAYWHDPALRTLVLWARNSYARYGTRPALDRFDAKAAIYLVRVNYPSPEDPKRTIDEWLSIRMVPGGGDPIGVGEPELYSYRGRRLDAVMEELFAHTPGSFWDSIVSSSRMCGIHPYAREGGRIIVGAKHRYTAACFGLIHVQFLLDYPPARFPFRYVTAIIRGELAERGLTLWKDGEACGPVFTPAYQLLGLADRSEVKLQRDVYAYEFPLYWLNRDQLLGLLTTLVRNGTLSQETVHHYLHAPLASEAALRRLGRLLTVDGPIVGAKCTGAELRELVDASVSEVPELKITRVSDWNRGVIRLTEAAGIDLFGPHPELQTYL